MVVSVVRPAGFNEKRCIVRDTLGLYGAVVTLGLYRTSTECSEDQLKNCMIRAAKQCVIQHAALRTIVRDAGSESPKLVQVYDLDLNEHLRFLQRTKSDEHSIRNLLHTIQNDALPQAHVRPQWRLFMVPCENRDGTSRFDDVLVAFSYSHSLLDGKSGALFQRSFLIALDNLENNDFDSSAFWKVPDGAPALLGPLNEIVTFKMTWKFLLAPVLNEYFPKVLTRLLGADAKTAQNAWLGAAHRPDLPEKGTLVETALCLVSISNDTVAEVLAQCRAHKTKLTGLLNHLLAHALADGLISQPQNSLSFTCQTALDLRAALPEEYKNAMANYVSACHHTIQVQDCSREFSMTAGDWSEAETATNELSASSKTLIDQPIALLKYLSNYRQWTLKKSTTRAEYAFSTSNIGVVDTTTNDNHGKDWQLVDMFFSQSASSLGAVIDINVASTKSGPLNIVVSWWPGMLGVEDEDHFIKSVCMNLEHMLQNVASQA